MSRLVRWILRIVAAAILVVSLVRLFFAAQLASSESSAAVQIRDWVVPILATIFLFVDYRFKRRADERAEAREIHDNNRRSDDLR